MEQRGHRQPGDLEVGANDLFLEHDAPHPAPRPGPPGWLLKWEARRPRWLVEMIGEAFGIFLYCWAGMSSTAIMIITMAADQQGFGSILTVSICYGLAISLAVVFVGPISGAHLSPGMSISFALFKGFPWRKVPYYMLAQFIGATIASFIVYAQFEPSFKAITSKMEAGGMDIFSSSSPVGSIVLFPPHGVSLTNVFVNEFIVAFVVAIAIFCVLDPSNVFISPTSGPLLIGLTFIVAIACFASNGIAINSARDLGARFAMACIYGRKVFPGKYAALSALTNILATQVGAMFQLLFMSDTVRPPTSGSLAAHAHAMKIEEAHLNRQLTKRTNDGSPESGMGSGFSEKTDSGVSVQHVERV